ncbi:phage holin family protein [Jannaschia sp. KMU-145]|uniref:phage holin family protein n=1 Tax=Jannaschia halovivens TaxID=3388667 RepID=UPI00396AF1E9
MKDDAHTDEPRAKGATGIIGDVLGHVSNLIRKEVDLARSEINENLTRAGIAIGLLVGALVIALVALNVLAAALVAAITELGIDAGWSALIVGGLLAVVAFAMVAKGINDLKLSSLAPTRTVKNVRRDAEAVKETL